MHRLLELEVGVAARLVGLVERGFLLKKPHAAFDDPVLGKCLSQRKACRRRQLARAPEVVETEPRRREQALPRTPFELGKSGYGVERVGARAGGRVRERWLRVTLPFFGKVGKFGTRVPPLLQIVEPAPEGE